MTDEINHPMHYNAHPSGVECITVTEHMSFNRGNAMKYLWRAGEKDCSVEGTLKDLEKAIWYINREINFLVEHTYLPDKHMSHIQEMEEMLKDAIHPPLKG